MCDECPDLIQEVRRIREENAAKFNHDINAIFADARTRQQTSDVGKLAAWTSASHVEKAPQKKKPPTP